METSKGSTSGDRFWRIKKQIGGRGVHEVKKPLMGGYGYFLERVNKYLLTISCTK